MKDIISFFMCFHTLFSLACALLLIQDITDELVHVKFSCLINKNNTRTILSGKLHIGEEHVLATMIGSDRCVALYKHSRCSVDDMYLHMTSPLTLLLQSLTSYMCDSKEPHPIIYFTKPSNASCNPPVFDKTGPYITLNCSTSRIYPVATCEFTIYYNAGTISLNLKINYCHIRLPGLLTFYSSVCSVHIPLAQLPEGNYQYFVKIFPENRKETFGIISKGLTFKLANTELKLAASCPSGAHVKNKFILAGTEAKCICFMDNQPGQLGGVQWYNNDTVPNSTYIDDFHSILTVTYPRDFHKTFTCLASTGNTDSEKIFFNPQFAYGPNSIKTSTSAVTMETCSTVSFLCFVSDVVSPGLNFEINSEKQESLGINFQIFHANQTSRITLTSGNKTGMYIVKCKAINSIFEKVLVEVSITVNVIEYRPELSIYDGGQIKYSLLPMKINITCSVEGSHKLKRLLIVCSRMTHKTTSNVLVIQQFITEEDLDLTCSCIVEYYSDCSTFKSASLKVNITKDDKESNTTLILCIVCIALGCLLLIILITGLTKYIIKRKKVINSSMDMDSMEYSDNCKNKTISTALSNSSGSSKRPLLSTHSNNSTSCTSDSGNTSGGNTSGLSSDSQITVIQATEENFTYEKIKLKETVSLSQELSPINPSSSTIDSDCERAPHRLIRTN